MSVGIGLCGIKTYGELCEAIENTKNAIKRVKKGPFYEYGDEFDLELHLIHLVKTKLYNEKKDEISMICCNNCTSDKLIVEKHHIIETLEYEIITTCQDCGYQEVKRIPKTFDLDQWVEDNWVHHMPRD